MKLYGAIDLHSNNNVTVLIDEQDQVVYQKRLPNDLPVIVQQLSGYQAALQGIVVESTYNWYWLVDGLMDKGHKVHLANTAAIQQYNGLKYTDDNSDARWLAHILRLGVLPQGYIYPKGERAVRDLLRKRSQMVHQRTANLLSIQNLVTRNTGSSISANQIKDSISKKSMNFCPTQISPWRLRLTCRSCRVPLNRRRSWSEPSGIESS
jgi:transposase